MSAKLSVRAIFRNVTGNDGIFILFLAPRICLSGQFQCHNNKTCIVDTKLCDNTKNCDDASDETYC